MTFPSRSLFAGEDDLCERYAEHQALETCRSATFLFTVRHFGLASSITARQPKGKNVTVKASQIWAARKSFFARLDLNCQSCRLTANGDALVELFSDWLLHDYSQRYHSLVSEEQLQWLKKIVVLIVARHLMETKYSLYLQGFQSFVDPWVCGVMCHLQEMGSVPGNVAKMVHHITADPEQQTALIEQFYQQTDDRMTRYRVVLPEPLPLLPDGALLPFALLSREDRHE